MNTTIAIIGDQLVSPAHVEHFNHLYRSTRVLQLSYGTQVAGHRFHLVIIVRQPRTERDQRWLEEHVYTRLVPGAIVTGV